MKANGTKPATKKPAKAKPKRGRPPIKFDLEEIEKLGAIGATKREMASWLEVAESTVAKKMGEHEDFRTAYNKGYGRTKMSLRRQQIELASKGNVAMLIWLGKQLLEQHDRYGMEHTGANGGPIQTRELSKEDESKIRTIADRRQALLTRKAPAKSNGNGTGRN